MAGIMEEYGSWIVEVIAGLGILEVWLWLVGSGFNGLAAAVLKGVM